MGIIQVHDDMIIILPQYPCDCREGLIITHHLVGLSRNSLSTEAEGDLPEQAMGIQKVGRRIQVVDILGRQTTLVALLLLINTLHLLLGRNDHGTKRKWAAHLKDDLEMKMSPSRTVLSVKEHPLHLFRRQAPRIL